MKNKNLLIGLCSVPLLLSISTNMIAQDLRERTYYYEILEPRHEPKPEIKGFATSRDGQSGNRYCLFQSCRHGEFP
jgi:rhamnogalacturonan endolyase